MAIDKRVIASSAFLNNLAGEFSKDNSRLVLPHVIIVVVVVVVVDSDEKDQFAYSPLSPLMSHLAGA
jgi:hypothetical protein